MDIQENQSFETWKNTLKRIWLVQSDKELRTRKKKKPHTQRRIFPSPPPSPPFPFSTSFLPKYQNWKQRRVSWDPGHTFYPPNRSHFVLVIQFDVHSKGLPSETCGQVITVPRLSPGDELFMGRCRDLFRWKIIILSLFPLLLIISSAHPNYRCLFFSFFF